jgi:hypothetical protein
VTPYGAPVAAPQAGEGAVSDGKLQHRPRRTDGVDGGRTPKTRLVSAVSCSRFGPSVTSDKIYYVKSPGDFA